jgi:hypothetical protein
VPQSGEPFDCAPFRSAPGIGPGRFISGRSPRIMPSLINESPSAALKSPLWLRLAPLAPWLAAVLTLRSFASLDHLIRPRQQ